MALSRIAVQHADNGYSRCRNLGGSLIHNMVLIYSFDGTNIYGSRGGKLEGIGSVYCRGLKAENRVPRGHFLFTF